MAEVKSGRAGALVKLAVLVAILVGGLLIAPRTPLGPYLTPEGVFRVIDWLRDHPLAPVIFVALYAAATALAIPGTILTLAGGALFGFYWGTLFNLLAANIGANAAFLVARTLGRDGVRKLMGDDSRALSRLDGIVKRHGFQGLLTLRLIPLVPFNALNFGSGLMSLSWRTYAAATVIGIVPGTAVYTFFANALLEGSREASVEAWSRVAVAGVLLVILSLAARDPEAPGSSPAGDGRRRRLLRVAGRCAGCIGTAPGRHARIPRQRGLLGGSRPRRDGFRGRLRETRRRPVGA